LVGIISSLLFFATPILCEDVQPDVVSFVVDSGIETIFKDNLTPIVISVAWPNNANENSTFAWEVKDGERVIVSGDSSSSDGLPENIETEIIMKKGGRRTITVDLNVEEGVYSTSSEFQVYASIVAIFPLIFVIVCAVTTQMVELSLAFGILVGAGIFTGSLRQGFIRTLETYLVNSVGDGGHAYVYLFTFFIAGLIAIMEKSGGIAGFARTMSSIVRTSLTGQLSCFLSGAIIFFDDYANCLAVGQIMRPTLDSVMVSREKLAFIVDASAAPIASLVPISSWVGYEISLIDEELEKIMAKHGEDLTIATKGYSIFLYSMKYRYYSIFMLIFIFINIVSKREFGSMLIAERKVVVYGRTDGGDGGSKDIKKLKSDSFPESDTPAKIWNFIVPVLLWIFFIFYLLVMSGDDGTGTMSFLQKIESSDSYVALLDGTMATVLLTMLFYLVQFKKNGELVMPELRSFFSLCGKKSRGGDDADESSKGGDIPPVPIVTVRESSESFFSGLAKVFPALIILTLAWAIGAVMSDVGADRLFASWIKTGLNPKALPTVAYIISTLIALCTGTSWGTMAIVFPIMLGPTYNATDDEIIFYATVAGILAGSITGDHISPISDTTVLSSLACECDLMAHVSTQLPYAGVVAFWSIIVGTVPIGYGSHYPNLIAIFLGFVTIAGTIMGLGVPVINSNGRYSPTTELWLKIRGENEALNQLKNDTIATYEQKNSNTPSSENFADA